MYTQTDIIIVYNDTDDIYICMYKCLHTPSLVCVSIFIDGNYVIQALFA